MKITSIEKTATHDKFTVTCACGKCGVKLKGTERFCPECGVRLVRCPCMIDAEDVVKLLNEALDKGMLKDASKGYLTKGGFYVVDGVGEKQFPREGDGEGEAPERCIIGRSSAISCPHLDKQSNACHAVVCPSFPPQYPVCTFLGNGFVPADA